MDRKTLLVSVVIPCFNEEFNIGQCIDSIISQTYCDKFEIIAVDNGSTDNTVHIINDKKIALAYAKRRGPAAAKNGGIRRAKGDILVFLDADCVAHPEWLVNMIKPFEDSSIGCVAGEIAGFEPKTVIESFLIQKKHLSQSVNVGHQFLPFAATANAAYRKEIFQKVGFFDEDLFIGEDADMSWRMQLKTNYKLSYSPEAIVYHPHETSLKALFRQKQRHADGAVALYKKYNKYWKPEHKELKQLYWEYNSIVRRSLLLGIYKIKRHFGFKSNKPLPFNEQQLILELASKVGMIKGSLKHRVWYI